jgi:hypothetical protein
MGGRVLPLLCTLKNITVMKRILFVSTGDSFPQGAFTFLQTLVEQDPVCLTGLFFCPLDYELMASASHVPLVTPYMELRAREKNIVDRNKELFARECQTYHIKHHTHENDDRWDKALFARESRFSDLVVLSGQLFCEDGGRKQPNMFLREALHTAECPVIVVPEDYEPVQHLVIAYDGSRDSLHAIKQFCYLFPQYTDLPTEIVYVKDETSEDIPDVENLKHFTRLHFSSMGFSKLHFRAGDYFASWIGEKKSAMLITGAFGRSALSYVAKRSFAEQVISEHGLPVFIAHM